MMTQKLGLAQVLNVSDFRWSGTSKVGHIQRLALSEKAEEPVK